MLPHERAAVEGLLVIGPAELLELLLREAAEHWHEIGIGVVGDLVVAEHLDRPELPEQLQAPGHRAVEVEPRHRVDTDQQHAELLTSGSDVVRAELLATSLQTAALLDLELARNEGKVVPVDRLVATLTLDADELVVDEGGLLKGVAVSADTERIPFRL